MKKLSWIDKLIFAINSLFAAILLFSNLLHFISPKSMPTAAVFSLTVPGLIIINVCFVVYWLVKLRKQFLLSTLVLLIGFQQVGAFFKFSNKEVFLNDDLKVMSYNVRLFNIYKWKEEGKEETLKMVYDFVENKDPDIVCFQEFLTEYDINFDFKYKYIQNNPNKKVSYFGLAIFSKYKIINKGSIGFDNSANNTIFVDVLKGKDTIRIYNVHLESQQLNLDQENFGEKDSERLFKRFKNTFTKQVPQVEEIVTHEKQINHKVIMMGDFNNTAFSWAYRNLKGDKQDAFVKAGKNFGKSYDYFFPARIDFILPDKSFKVNNFKTFDIKYSDHFPIMARLNLN